MVIYNQKLMSPVPDLFFLLEQHVTLHHGNETADVSKYRARFTVLVSCLPGLQTCIITIVAKSHFYNTLQNWEDINSLK